MHQIFWKNSNLSISKRGQFKFEILLKLLYDLSAEHMLIIYFSFFPYQICCTFMEIATKTDSWMNLIACATLQMIVRIDMLLVEKQCLVLVMFLFLKVSYMYFTNDLLIELLCLLRVTHITYMEWLANITIHIYCILFSWINNLWYTILASPHSSNKLWIYQYWFFKCSNFTKKDAHSMVIRIRHFRKYNTAEKIIIAPPVGRKLAINCTTTIWSKAY